ncbi:hypothetical protein BVX98_00565 [bacterium F11]|nr:hypothetical protein BVX98_00565 [bacterium F11]
MPPEFTNTIAEDREIQKQSALKKRVGIWATLLVAFILIRVVVKNPPAYKTPDHGNVPVKYVPGMLDAMPEEDRAKLTPSMIAKYREADQKALTEMASSGIEEKWVETKYIPQEAPSEIRPELEAYKETLFQYAKKRRKIEAFQEKLRAEQAITKKMLVHFKPSGYVQAEEASFKPSHILIKVDESMLVRYPKRMVRSIKESPSNWVEPVPKGFVRLKPARGITMVVTKRTAKRIKTKRTS